MPASDRIAGLPGRSPLERHDPPRPAANRLRAFLDRLKTAVARRRGLEQCSVCGTGTLRTISVDRRPVMGEIGPPELTVRCDNAGCGHGERRMYGYTGPAERASNPL